MKRILTRISYTLTACVAFLSLFLAPPAARAGMTIDTTLYISGFGTQNLYGFWPWLNTNLTGAPAPFGSYLINSPDWPAAGTFLQYQYDTNGFNLATGGGGLFFGFDDVVHELTNGAWSITVTNSTSTNIYHFAVTITNLGSNSLPVAIVTFPTNGAAQVTNNPTFIWQGPSNYTTLNVNVSDANGTYYQSASLPPAQTSWPSPITLNEGTNSFSVNYSSNATSLIVASTPTNASNQPFPGWVSTATLNPNYNSTFTVGSPSSSVALIAHYDFNEGTFLAPDVSGNSNNITQAGTFGAGTIDISADSIEGAGAMEFNNGDSSDGGWLGPPAAGLLPTLAGSFSISLWVKTTQSFGSPGDYAYNGAGIVAADVPGQANDVVPVALTAGQVAFNVGGTFDQTLNSTATVNDGNYHHVVVTRDQFSGAMQIYIDGSLDSTTTGTSALLNAPQNVVVGGIDDASNPDPASAGKYNGYSGLIDDIQVYAGVLTGEEVSYLHSHPGSTVTKNFNTALGTTNLTWTTSGDTDWTIETTNTYNGAPAAAQSGSVTNSQTSTLSVTVTGPGTLTFYWSSIANDPNAGFDYEFYVDDPSTNDVNDLFGDNSWQQAGPYAISAGQHTLGWIIYANGDTDPAQAGFLDQVSYTPNLAPVITLNPFDQTNYPGYEVALLAGASSNASLTWRWFEVGGASPIPDATNALFIPTNSGTPGVAGSYYALASTPGGSANTTTAAVSFVNAPLPPDWSRAFKSPSVNNNTVTEEYYIASLPDSAGNLYTAGSFSGTNTIGSQTFIAANGSFETEVVKQSATGAAIWALAMTNNGEGSSEAEAIAPAPGNGLYVLGNLFGTNWLGPNELIDASGGGSIYLARLDANGNILWVRTISNPSGVVFTGFNCVVADPAGNVTLSGLIQGSTTFSSTNAATSTNLVASGQSGALAQYDANGTLRWAEIPGGWVLDMAYSAGRIYGTMFSPTAGFATITNVTDRRFTLAAINPVNGQGIWLRGVGAPQNAGNPFGIIDDMPLISVFGTNVTIVGTAFGSNAVFGPYTVSWDAEAGQYFARYDTNGNPQLATAFGSPTTLTWATLPDAFGNIYVGGDFDTFSFFGNDILAAPHEDSIGNGYYSQAFLAKFDRDGNPLWARLAQAQYNLVNFRSLAVAPNGIWACGVIKSPTTFGSNVVSSSLTCFGSPFCTITYQFSGVLGMITDRTLGLPVTLLNPHDNGVNFQFSFQSESGFTHSVEYRTNLITGSTWQVYSNVAGDGTLKTIPIPLSVFSPSHQGFVRVSTQ